MDKEPTYEELTQRVKELEKGLDEKVQFEDRLRTLSLALDQSSEGIAVVDLDGNLEYLNPSFAIMHGYSPEELIGKNLSVFHSPEQLPSVDAANRQLKETGDFKGEIWHISFTPEPAKFMVQLQKVSQGVSFLFGKSPLHSPSIIRSPST